MRFNGIKKDWLAIGRDRSKAPFAPINRTLMSVPGMDGNYLSDSQTGSLIIRQPVFYLINDNDHALQLKDELADWLYTKEPAPLEFSDEPGRIYYAVVQNTLDDFKKIAHSRRGTITFLVPDGFSYGPEKEITSTEDTFIVENNGTAEAEPIIELTAKAKATFAMISIDDEKYNLIGQPADVDEKIVDTKTLLFEERGEFLSKWTSAGTSVDGGVVDGSLNTDGDGITVPDYGTGDKWHGPALIREIDPIQDFEVEMMLESRFSNVNQTYRIEFYLFDEFMNVIGKMSVLDNSTGANRTKAEGRVGPFLGGNVNYLISSQNYMHNWRDFFGMLRMKRIGNRFDFYVTRVASDSQHVYSLLQSYNDVDNQHQGRLKYIQIHIGKYADTPNAFHPKINHIRVYELSQALVDQTPYIVYPNDIIEFDHVTKDIRLNGESRKDLKAFGGSFFTLKKGINTLTITPENTFNTKITYRERYK